MHLNTQFCFVLSYTYSRDAEFDGSKRMACPWKVMAVRTPRSVRMTEYQCLVTFRSDTYLELDNKFGKTMELHSKTYGKNIIEVFEQRYKLRTVFILLLRRNEESHSDRGVGTGQVFSQSMTESIEQYSYRGVVRLCLV